MFRIIDSIRITRPVIIKVRVTEGYKKSVSAEVREALAGLDARMKHLEFQAKRLTEMEKKDPRGQAGDFQKLEAERQKVLESRRVLTERLKEIGRLVEGQEVVHGRVESFVEVKVGDRWDSVMSVELVLQDGEVVEIRQGGLP
ncbi:MAG: YlqD family protein [Bacillota bacterium]